MLTFIFYDCIDAYIAVKGNKVITGARDNKPTQKVDERRKSRVFTGSFLSPSELCLSAIDYKNNYVKTLACLNHYTITKS